MRYVALFVFVLAAPRGAQEPVLPPGGPDMSPAEIQKLFDGYLIVQAQEALALSEQQFAQFLPRLDHAAGHAPAEPAGAHSPDQRAAAAHATNERTRRGRCGRRRPLKERLSALQELEARSAAEMRKAYNAIDEVLDVPQQARFRVFEEPIERKKLDLVMRARQQQQNRPQSQSRAAKAPATRTIDE